MKVFHRQLESENASQEKWKAAGFDPVTACLNHDLKGPRREEVGRLGDCMQSLNQSSQRGLRSNDSELRIRDLSHRQRDPRS